MTIEELNREQLVELKQHFICESNEENNEKSCWSDMADANEIVSDETIMAVYSGYDFSNDDFFCSCEKCEEEKS